MRVRCISLWQPWASLMALNLKTVETRHWNTNVRGKIYIQAAKTRGGIKSLHPLTAIKIDDALGVETEEMFDKLPFGKLICHGELTSCIDSEKALDLYPSQEHFGDFSKGRFGHIYNNLTRIDPIGVKGAQGFFFTYID